VKVEAGTPDMVTVLGYSLIDWLSHETGSTKTLTYDANGNLESPIIATS
jgi:hypothetical protein